jgi:hypothetical protein
MIMTLGLIVFITASLAGSMEYVWLGLILLVLGALIEILL